MKFIQKGKTHVSQTWWNALSCPLDSHLRGARDSCRRGHLRQWSFWCPQEWRGLRSRLGREARGEPASHRNGGVGQPEPQHSRQKHNPKNLNHSHSFTLPNSCATPKPP